ncbi:hypothetical protein PAP_03100 [Palaeococcus pacificus DY20341]|uniref:DNA double-strand break repair Rad50 ATPase n=1 Tax=Palaeococcus pacificus DY20341 TaxID=1343739 RepID=A0A075LQP2_9EURY|nr:hypothetical protein [Palaeococcus pacificus]AIF69040.1 hypothetical protein PAP_03100 [Palaeococcus pacificus DY20341]
MKWKVWALVLLLVGSVIPAGIALADENGTQSLEEYSLSLDNSTQEEIIAERLINQLTRISELTESHIEKIRDKLPENSTILENYETAEAYKEKAIQEYEAEDYYNSILDSLTSMHYYKIVLTQLKEGKERIDELRDRLPEEIKRMQEYFGVVERTIRIAENQGIDVSNLTLLYNETKDAYKQVLDDLKAKDFEKAKEDLEIAKEKKAALDEELMKVREELAYMNADKIVKDFLIKTEKGITFAERVIEEAKNRGIDTSEAEAKLEEIKVVYEEVKGLAAEEKWEDALDVIKENRGKIERFFKTLDQIHEKIAEERMKKDLRVFLREVGDRIRKDAKALQVLKNRGVDTRRAELELRTAVQEVQLGLRLAKEGRIAQAKMHFGIALRLLYSVDQFILRHA